jgi:DRTGG domain
MDKMMNLRQIIDQLNLNVLTESRDFANMTPTGGYSSDLLSCVMAGAKKGSIWITLQAHLNIVAVAALNEVAAIIITENAQPDAASIAKANQQGVILLSTPQSTYEINGQLWQLGIRN